LQDSQKLSRQTLGKVREEVGDVLIYLLRLADKLGIDPLVAATDKLEINRLKYPAERVRGKAKKYSDY
jgi:NTP pyrophosphatase (non-canonical NTP hydrolase)